MKNIDRAVIGVIWVISVFSGAGCQQGTQSKGDTELVFRTKVSDLLIQPSAFTEGKTPDDLVEVALPGRFYDPPLQGEIIQRSSVDRSTPEKSSVSDFSAFKADDAQWILENFADEDHLQIKGLLDNHDARRRNKAVFDRYETQKIFGRCEYKNYVLLLTGHDDAQEAKAIETYVKVHESWKRTNALSADETFDVIFSAVFSGEIVQRKTP